MLLMENPSWTNVGPGLGVSSSGGPNLVPPPSLRHDPLILTDWTHEEQSILEVGLREHTSESKIIRYAKIAVKLPNRTIRDVAFRCKWMMSEKECKKRKKKDLATKNKNRKGKVTESSSKACHVAEQPSFNQCAQQGITAGSDGDFLYKAIGGATGKLLEQNFQCFNKISMNFTFHQLNDNIYLFYQAYQNIFDILNNFSDGTEAMKHMPSLPVKFNEELFEEEKSQNIYPI